jgi:uncharacterized protein YlxP (DUF503 family)
MPCYLRNGAEGNQIALVMCYTATMIIAAMTIRLHAPWVHSLKEKRTEVRSLLDRVRRQFNVSAAEVGDQDIHQSIIIGIVAIAANGAQADSILDNVIRFVEANSEALIVSIDRERR